MKFTKYFNWFTVTLSLLIYIGVNFLNGILVDPVIPLIAFILLITKFAIVVYKDFEKQGI